MRLETSRTDNADQTRGKQPETRECIDGVVRIVVGWSDRKWQSTKHVWAWRVSEAGTTGKGRATIGQAAAPVGR